MKTPDAAARKGTRGFDPARLARAIRRAFEWKDAAVLDGWRLGVAYALIGGAVIGVVAFGADVLVPGAEGERAPFEHLVAMLFCACSALAGWFLLNRQRIAYWPAVAVLAVQAVWIYTPWASYRIAAGLALLPSWTTGRGFDVIVGGTAAFRLAIMEPMVGYGLGLNLWSFVAIAALTAWETKRRAARPAKAPVNIWGRLRKS